ncbi:MAG: PTS system mannose/fructose/sorbose family transporter subunit IID [Desulfohalobiaceae bacterium]
MSLKLKTLLHCFWRTYFIGANFNTRGLQNLGLAYAMDPGLKMLYPGPAELKQARKRYLSLFNSHPYWVPLLVGYFLFLESRIAKGLLPAQAMNKVKNTTAYTLSAIGDSFFGGSVLVLWSLVCCLVLIQGWYWLALLWFVFCFLLLQAFRLLTFWLGWLRGLTFLQQLKGLNLINWGQRVKVLNAGLIVLLWYNIYPLSREGPLFLLVTALAGGLVFLVYRRILFREVLLFLLVCAWLLTMEFLNNPGRLPWS